MIKRIRIAPRLLAAFALAGATSLHAAPLDNRIPKDALLYIGWQGADALAPAYANSNIKGMMDNSTLPAYIQQQMPRWIDMATQKDPDAPAQIADAKAALTVLWHHPVSVYVGPVDFSSPHDSKPRIALLCDAGADAPALAGVIEKTLAKAGPTPVPMNITTKAGVVILTIGNLTADEFAVHPGALSTAPAYVAAMKHVRPNGAMVAYGDPQAFLAMIGDALSKDTTVPPDARQKYESVVEGLGLRSITQFVSSSGFDGKGWSDEAFIGINGPRTGLVALADAGPVSAGALAMIPQSAVQFGISKFDPSKLLALARDIAGRIDAQANDKLDQSLAMGSLIAGFDIEKDLLNALGDEWIVYRFPSPDGVGIASALVHKLKAPENFGKTLTSIEALINARAGATMQVEPADADGIPVSSVQTPVVSVAWTVRNGYFYISTLAAMSAVVHQVEQHLPAITANDSYNKAIAELPHVKPTSISYSDPAKIYPESYRAASTMLPLLRAAGIAVPISILPSPAKAAPFLTPAASISWSDAEGFHFISKD